MRKILLSLTLLVGFASQAVAADNYAATAGSGLTFGAKDAAGVLYSRFIGCDNTTVSQCWAVDASGRLTVNVNGTVTVSGTVAATQSGTWTVQPGNTANTTPWLVEVDNTLTAVTPGDGITTTIYGTAPASPVIGSPLLFNGSTYDRARSGGVTGMQGVSIQASPTGGCTPNGVITAGASTNATSVKASAGTLCDFSAANTTTTLYWVHFYNNAGTPTCNTGIIESYPVSAAPAVGQVGGWSRPFPQGHAYGTGIGICITANADGTGNAAAGVTLNIGYK